MANASQKFKPSKWNKPSNEPITREKDENIKELQKQNPTHQTNKTKSPQTNSTT